MVTFSQDGVMAINTNAVLMHAFSITTLLCTDPTLHRNRANKLYPSVPWSYCMSSYIVAWTLCTHACNEEEMFALWKHDTHNLTHSPRGIWRLLLACGGWTLVTFICFKSSTYKGEYQTELHVWVSTYRFSPISYEPHHNGHFVHLLSLAALACHTMWCLYTVKGTFIMCTGSRILRVISISDQPGCKNLRKCSYAL